VEFGWYVFLVLQENDPYRGGGAYADSTIIRFNFISDSLDTQKEGWMIDDISIFSYDFGGNINEVDFTTFDIIPNPVSDRTKIQLESSYQKIHARLYSTEGKLIEENYFESGSSFELERNQLPKGNYVLKVFADKQFLGSKIIVFE